MAQGKSKSGIRTELFFGREMQVQETNSWGRTKEQMDKRFHSRERKGRVKHMCWFKECRSKMASIRCRICGERQL